MQTISIVLEILLFILGLYLAFFKSYFQEKGKNLATKEDIEEITTKVEGIKTEFIKETEKLKTDLQFENHVKVSINTDTKNSIVEMVENYNFWLILIMDSFNQSLSFDTKKVEKVRSDLQQAYFKFVMSESKLYLYQQDNQISDLLGVIKEHTIRFQGIFLYYLMDLEFILQREESSIKLEDKTNFVSKRTELFSKQCQPINDSHKAVFTEVLNLRKMCYNRLTTK
ncbi:MAG TPA: hypothetical protein VN698_13080 [Bacteroidia bacterium]|nr:hypothetical protein [Bacteroidia bacterium]